MAQDPEDPVPDPAPVAAQARGPAPGPTDRQADRLSRAPLIEEIVELSFFGTVEERIEFLYCVREDRTAGVLGVGDHNRSTLPRYLDTVTRTALDGGLPFYFERRRLGVGHGELLSEGCTKMLGNANRITLEKIFLFLRRT